MAKFRCDKRVKWRSTSSSPSSGKPAMSARSKSAGMASSIRPASAGHNTALRPAEPLSNNSFAAGGRGRGSFGKGVDKAFDLLKLVRLGHTQQQTVLQLRIKIFLRNAGNDLFRGKFLKNFLRARRPH